MTNPSILVKRPVAFRVPRTDPATAGETLSTTEWRLFSDESEAAKDAALKSTDYDALYVRDGTAIVAEWEPINTAPLGENDFYLVCCNDPADDRSPFVVRGSIFASARKHPYTHHLSLGHLTHWMPLPSKPAVTSQDQTQRSALQSKERG